MGRMTRAKAAEVAEKLHVDEDVVLGLPSENGGVILNQTPERALRSPLGEIAPNSGSGQDEEDIAELRKSTRSRRGGKKGAKSKKTNLAASVASRPDSLGELPEVAPDETEAVSSPASEAAAEGLMAEGPGNTIPSYRDDITPDNAALQMVAQAQTQTLAEADPETLLEAQAETTYLTSTSLHNEAEDDQSEPATQIAIEAPASPPSSAMPAVVASLRKGTPGQRSTSNKENVKPIAGLMPSPATLARPPITITPVAPRSHRRSSTYDALEEAVVQGAVSPAGSREPSTMEPSPAQPAPGSMESFADASVELQPAPSLPEPAAAQVATPEVRVEAPTGASPKAEDPILAMDALDEAVEKISAEVPDVQPSPAKPKARKTAPVVRTTKASLARLSIAQADKSGIAAVKAPAAGRPRPSTTLARAGSIRQSIATKSEPASKRVPSTSSKRPEPAKDGEKKEAVIPHSKPRPVSLSFPTPPPPRKSKKALTTSSFQLPGEAIAAKLRAAREERAKTDTEEQQKRPAFKARPAPAGLKKAPSVRQTNASKARVSSVGDKPVAFTAGLKRANSVATSGAAAPKARMITKEASARSPNALKSIPDRLTVAKRQSTATANMSKPRVSLTRSTNTPASTPSGPTQRVPSKGTVKGKEVFNRTAAAKEAAEKEKREKEDVAKKARATASERSRQASRDWAEKQKMRKLGLKPGATKTAAAPVDPKEIEVAEHAVADEPTVLGDVTTGEVAASA
ncbi:hypothetical protein LTR85_006943 [Meristemomyces frigidus]|nr:hypothetical protein LTR85_006943 [Meristemomyces frigidus]